MSVSSGSIQKEHTAKVVHLDPILVEIKGKQVAAFANFVVRLTYRVPSGVSVRGFVHLPVDNGICVHSLSVIYLAKQIPLTCRDSGEPWIFLAPPKLGGRSLCLVSSPQDGVSTVEFRNLIPGEQVTLCLSMTLVAAASSANTIVFKFPFESCGPPGVLVSPDWPKIGAFVFYHKLTVFQEIRSVTSNLGGTWDRHTPRSGAFQLTKPTQNRSLILSIEFQQSIAESLPVRFGTFIVTFVMPRAISGGLAEQEFIFVVDCSESMGGGRIETAKACLEIFLDSLPSGGHFNVVRFGRQPDPLWETPRPATDKNVGEAKRYVESIAANLAGTELENVLTWILDSTPVFEGQKRQLFIVTDAEDADPDGVMQLVMRSDDKLRCFTIGLGRGADSGLVKGIASRTGGRYDFVHDAFDVRSTVLAQMEASMMTPIQNVHLQVTGVRRQFCVPDPIPPIPAGNLSVLFVRCPDLASEPEVVVTGQQRGCDVCYHTPPAFSCGKDVMSRAVSKYITSLRLIGLEQRISRLDKELEDYDELKRQVVEISIKSGIMCPFTSFVAVMRRPDRHGRADKAVLADGTDWGEESVWLEKRSASIMTNSAGSFEEEPFEALVALFGQACESDLRLFGRVRDPRIDSFTSSCSEIAEELRRVTSLVVQVLAESGPRGPTDHGLNCPRDAALTGARQLLDTAETLWGEMMRCWQDNMSYPFPIEIESEHTVDVLRRWYHVVEAHLNAQYLNLAVESLPT
jgi:hypothetical protein